MTAVDVLAYVTDGAVCAQVDTDIFFPTKGSGNRPAKQVCAGCPVRSECLQIALAFGSDLEGIWGGTSQRERRALARPEAAA